MDLGSWRVTEEWGRRYLEAVGDDRPEYLEAGFAPPLGLTAWVLGSLLEHLALPPGAIHSLQELETLNPVRWGDVIGATASIDGPKRRGGLQIITASYSLEDGSGRAVLKGRSTVLNIDPVAASSVGRDASAPPAKEQPAPASGGLPVVSKVITQDRLQAYAQVTGDSNPLHLDPEFAATTQFGGIIAHGMLTLAFIAQMMVAAFGRSWLESGTMRARFKGAAYIGDEVETCGQVTKDEDNLSGRNVTCSVGLRNRRSGQQLISASATVRPT
ncbi:MAG: MaoC family dehydratase N-terminal domain-containing protein [Chloroflexi bacterium]|nr:MaoC family dehydratase N-terminal domain-containing protein [Chloroflexota bacterium]